MVFPGVGREEGLETGETGEGAVGESWVVTGK